jgi:rare lipoprotein A
MKGRTQRAWILACAAGVLALGGCAETTLAVHAAKQIGRTEQPGPQGTYKIGDPYQINGTWYYPAEDYGYAESGIASFYGGETRGTNFHGRYTANGELYDMNALTAAHQTLPLPSLVRVTNLENGRAIVLRVNDRGPFARGRIVDVSRRAAQLLGFEGQGTARVRVEVLADESRALKAAMLGQGAPEAVAVAAAPRGSVVSDALPPPPGARASSDVARAALPPPSSTLPPAPPTASSGRGRVAKAQPAARPAPPVVAQPAPAQAAPATPAPVRRPAAAAPGAEVAALPVPQQAASTAVVTEGPVRPTNLYVQAGAFSNYDNAYRLSVRLSRYGRTNVSPVPSGAQQLYRVRVGPVNSVKEADALLAEVTGLAPEARIVVD